MRLHKWGMRIYAKRVFICALCASLCLCFLPVYFSSEPAATAGLTRQRIALSTEFNGDVRPARAASSGRRSLKEVDLSEENRERSGAAARQAEKSK